MENKRALQQNKLFFFLGNWIYPYLKNFISSSHNSKKHGECNHHHSSDNSLRGENRFFICKEGEEVVYLLDWCSYIKQVVSQNHRKAQFYFGAPKEELKCRSLKRIPGVS